MKDVSSKENVLNYVTKTIIFVTNSENIKVRLQCEHLLSSTQGLLSCYLQLILKKIISVKPLYLQK